MKAKVVWLSFSLTAVVSVCARAQQMPTLTTDDVIRARATEPPRSTTKQPEAKSQAAAEKSEAQLTPAEKQRRADEHLWNERLRVARERQKDLARRADQVELQITRVRNLQMDPTTPHEPSDAGRYNVEIEQLNAQVKALRESAKAAQDEVDQLLSEGEAKGYEVETVSLEKKNGRPNLAGYRKRWGELQTELRDATARAEVLQLRINQIYGERRRNEGGDNFYLNRLRAERADNEAELARVRARIAELTQELAQLRAKALAAGVPPGDLR